MLKLIRRTIRIPLLILVALWLIALVGSLALEVSDAPVSHSTVSWMLRSTSPLLVIMGWLLWAGMDRAGVAGRTRLLIAIGMSISCVGDVVMGQIIPTPEPILTGVAVFGTAHIIYIVAFATLAAGLGLTSPRARRASIAAGVAIGIACWSLFVQSPSAGLPLNVGSLIYAIIIGSMGGMALSLAIRDRRFISTAIGAALFMLSDVMLGAWALRDTHWQLIGDAVWWSYIIGQFLIVWSIGVLRGLVAIAPAPTQ